MTMLRTFWDAALELDPEASDQGRTMRYCSKAELRRLWSDCGFRGIETGELAVNLDGVAVENANDLRNRLAGTRVGKKVEIIVVRKGERITVQPVVEAYQTSPRLAALELESRLGMEVKEVSILEARKRRLNSREGVLVARVDPQGPAARAGLEVGDIVYQINQPLRGPKDYLQIVEQLHPGQEVLLQVRDWRTGETGYLTMGVQ